MGLLAVAALAAAAYVPTLAYDLVWDDLLLLRFIDGRVRTGGLLGLLASDFRLDPAVPSGYFRPVVLASLWLDRAASGLVPFSFHLTNVGLHALNCVLVVLAGRALTGCPRLAFAAGVLFAVHPVHVESVAFVSGRTDLWAAAFSMLALLAWTRGRLGLPRRLLPWPVWGGLAYLLAGLSKEVAVLLPLVALGWDAVAPIRSEGGTETWWKRNRSWCAAWGIALVAFIALRWVVAGLPPVPAAATGAGPAFGDWALRFSMFAEYVRLLVLPWPLKAVYTRDQLGWAPVSLLALVAFLGLAVLAARSGARRLSIAGPLWIIGFLLPVLGTAPLRWTVVAERFLYLPSVGFCLLAAAALGAAGQRLRSSWAAPALLAALAALGAAGVAQASRAWRSEESLFTQMIRTTPRSEIAYFNLANARAGQGLQREAAELYRAALRLRPEHFEAQNNLGIALAREGRAEEALLHFRAALRLRPESGNAHNNLGLVLAGLGRSDEAALHYREAIRLQPDLGEAYRNLGDLLAAEGRDGEAASLYREAVRLRPEDAEARANLARTLGSLRPTGETETAGRPAQQNGSAASRQSR